MQLPNAEFTELIKHHTLHLDQQVDTSTGPSTDYFDGIGVFLCQICRKEALRYLESALYLPPIPSWQEVEAKWDGDIDNGALYAQLYDPHVPAGTGIWLWPVATGASGAIILGALGHGTYLAPRNKDHGPLWRSLWVAQFRRLVALVDDCIFTGGTMDYAQLQCKLAGLEVVREVVLLGARPVSNKGAVLTATETAGGSDERK